MKVWWIAWLGLGRFVMFLAYGEAARRSIIIKVDGNHVWRVATINLNFCTANTLVCLLLTCRKLNEDTPDWSLPVKELTSF